MAKACLGDTQAQLETRYGKSTANLANAAGANVGPGGNLNFSGMRSEQHNAYNWQGYSIIAVVENGISCTKERLSGTSANPLGALQALGQAQRIARGTKLVVDTEKSNETRSRSGSVSWHSEDRRIIAEYDPDGFGTVLVQSVGYMTQSAGGGVRFSELPMNATFFFPSDTNRTYLWAKISSATASNTVSKVVSPLTASMLVIHQGVLSAGAESTVHPKSVRFSELPFNSAFYVQSDKVRNRKWVKLSAVNASNTLSKAIAPFPPTTPVIPLPAPRRPR